MILSIAVSGTILDTKFEVDILCFWSARIPVPGAYNLVGIADVHQELGPNEISVCIMQKDSGKLEYLSGPCLVSRSPTIHPGDVQIVHAIGKPGAGSCFEHEPLPNTLVFSTRGMCPVQL